MTESEHLIPLFFNTNQNYWNFHRALLYRYFKKNLSNPALKKHLAHTNGIEKSEWLGDFRLKVFLSAWIRSRFDYNSIPIYMITDTLSSEISIYRSFILNLQREPLFMETMSSYRILPIFSCLAGRILGILQTLLAPGGRS